MGALDTAELVERRVVAISHGDTLTVLTAAKKQVKVPSGSRPLLAPGGARDGHALKDAAPAGHGPPTRTAVPAACTLLQQFVCRFVPASSNVTSVTASAPISAALRRSC